MTDSAVYRDVPRGRGAEHRPPSRETNTAPRRLSPALCPGAIDLPDERVSAGVIWWELLSNRGAACQWSVVRQRNSLGEQEK
jgi:hypothetical protein